MEVYLDEVSKFTPDDYFEENYRIIEVLGSGSYGKVVKCLEIKTDEIVAVKIIDTCNFTNKYLNKIRSEYKILEKLNHPNIIYFKGFIECSDKFHIVMNYVQGGTLSKFITSNLGPNCNFSEDDASRIMKSIFKAVDYMHSNNIIHRDIKPENIVMKNQSELSSLSLIDFGLSKVHNDFFENEYCGTLKYMAPELMDKKMYNKSVDIWSCGIIMYMLLNDGEHPFLTEGSNSKQELIENIKQKKSISFHNNISEMGMHLIKKLLDFNPSKRYTADIVLRHPWISRNNQDEVPLTYVEEWKKRKMKDVAISLLGSMIFLNSQKPKTSHKKLKSSYIKELERHSLILKTKLVRKKEKCLEKLDTKENLSKSSKELSVLIDGGDTNNDQSTAKADEAKNKKFTSGSISIRNIDLKRVKTLKLNLNSKNILKLPVKLKTNDLSPENGSSRVTLFTPIRNTPNSMFKPKNLENSADEIKENGVIKGKTCLSPIEYNNKYISSLANGAISSKFTPTNKGQQNNKVSNFQKYNALSNMSKASSLKNEKGSNSGQVLQNSNFSNLSNSKNSFESSSFINRSNKGFGSSYQNDNTEEQCSNTQNDESPDKAVESDMLKQPSKYKSEKSLNVFVSSIKRTNTLKSSSKTLKGLASGISSNLSNVSGTYNNSLNTENGIILPSINSKPKKAVKVSLHKI